MNDKDKDFITCHVVLTLKSKTGSDYLLESDQLLPVRPIPGDIIDVGDGFDTPCIKVKRVCMTDGDAIVTVECTPIGFDGMTVYDMLDIDGWSVDVEDEDRIREEWKPDYLKEDAP